MEVWEKERLILTKEQEILPRESNMLATIKSVLIFFGS